ncbi:hypothetical protein KIW84_014267 [Lathyrus oleraceus]|uniref:Uncharacterized protein n=1 Tax=Pisum sativum TaxID=3888 RepID=A0A9D5BMR2_PEA|nr:hypothetical protein KIW84_014267 [Pisum sativum]
MASRLKRKVAGAEKGKGTTPSSSMEVQHIFKDHTPEKLERYEKYYQKKTIQTPKYGKKIVLTPKKLGQILDIPFGVSILYDLDDKEWKDYNKRDFHFSLSRILEEEYHEKRVDSHGEEEPPKDFWSARNFFINDRLLHYFLVYVMIPRNSNHCNITDLEMQALYTVKNDIAVNWSRLILHHMMTHITKLKSLQYSWFITRIIEHFNVDFDDVEYSLMDTMSHKIYIKNMDKRMGYRYNSKTKMVTFIGGNNKGNEENAQEGDGGEDVPPPNGPSNQALFDFMTTRFSNLNTSINDQWTSANNHIA